MDMKAARIRLHIGELIVNGLAVGDRDALGNAIRRELTRLLAADALPSALTRTRQIPALNAGVVQAASPRTDALGAAVAQAVHGGLRK